MQSRRKQLGIVLGEEGREVGKADLRRRCNERQLKPNCLLQKRIEISPKFGFRLNESKR